MNKKNQRIAILLMSLFIIGSIWLIAYLKNNFVTDEYEGAFWLSLLFYGIGIYVVIAHYIIEGK